MQHHTHPHTLPKMKIEVGTMVLLTIIAVSSLFPSASSLSFHVGDANGWVTPGKNYSQYYNIWATKKRFILGDTLVFHYKADSMMEVSEADYRRCTATKPVYFSNDGNSEVELDRPGLHYFISGVKEHCVAGQRMVVSVLDVEAAAAAVEATQSPSASPDISGVAPVAGSAAVLLLLSAVASCSYMLV